MKKRNPIHDVTLTLALAVMLGAGCGSEEPIVANATSNEITGLTPSIDRITQSVSLDDDDRAVVVGALEQWRKAAAGSTAPFRAHRGGMEFLATVAPSLDNEQLADLVDYLREFREEHRKKLGGHHAGRTNAHMDRLAESLQLSAEQRSAMEAIHSDLRKEARSVHEALRAGTMTAEQVDEAVAALHDAHRKKLADVLTEEQFSQLDAFREKRHAETIDRRLAHMDDRVDTRVDWLTAMLGLNADQQSTIRAALEKSAAERKQALEAAREDGAPTRVMSFQRLHDHYEDVLAALENTLTPEQSERLEILRRLHPGESPVD